MAEAISQLLKKEIRARAGSCCEYCLIPEFVLLAGCEVDHVVSRKHGGATEFSNLALSCARCNRYKGTDVGTIDEGSRTFIRLYNPRQDNWSDHFIISGSRITGKSPMGQATARLLRFNDEERVLERAMLQQAGIYRKV